MTRERRYQVVAVVGGLSSIGNAVVVWALHPMPRPDANNGSFSSLLWGLGAGVFVVAFLATLAVLLLTERRQRAKAQSRESVRRPS